VKPLMESLAASANLIPCHLYFVLSPADDAELAAVKEERGTYAVVDWPIGTQGDYAKKINFGFERLRDEYEFMLLGADDLVFHPGWIEAALAAHQRTHACVVGTNDSGNQRVMRGDHSTHSLVHRDYWECGTADEPHKIYHEGYWHNYVDDEMVQTAKVRQTFTYAHDAMIEHMHPDWQKAAMDETYRLGKQHFNQDAALHQARQHLWLS